MASVLVNRVAKPATLKAAWRAIYKNGRSSKSDITQEEVEAFSSDAEKKLKNISNQLKNGTYKFQKAKGIRLTPEGKKEFRPIVIAKIEDRIVQRAVHDVLIKNPKIMKFVNNPHSFGGIRKKKKQKPEDESLSAVPAAIQAILSEIKKGSLFIIRSDISKFFTRIQKSEVTAIVKNAVQDEEFVDLFARAIKVELENMSQLREDVNRFPIEDLGVAQGNCLSPLLGNLILNDFDTKMNKGECRCLRYIDDFIILAADQEYAEKKFQEAQSILADLGMSLSIPKSRKAAIKTEKFDFLGIEFDNGFIRPSPEACGKILTSIAKALEESARAFLGYKSAKTFYEDLSLIKTITKISGMLRGWGKHYYFCNDGKVFKRVDLEVDKKLRKYLGVYTSKKDQADDAGRRKLLGVTILSEIGSTPFSWQWKP